MKPLLRLKPYLKPYRSLILISALLAIPLSALRAAPMKLLKVVADDLLARKPRPSSCGCPGSSSGSTSSISSSASSLLFFENRHRARRSEAQERSLRTLLGLSADYFTAQSTGSLISRVGSTPRSSPAESRINVLAREPLTLLSCFRLRPLSQLEADACDFHCHPAAGVGFLGNRAPSQALHPS